MAEFSLEQSLKKSANHTGTDNIMDIHVAILTVAGSLHAQPPACTASFSPHFSSAVLSPISDIPVIDPVPVSLFCAP